MKVSNLTRGSKTYTSNVYLVRGDWNTLDDINTLVDVGRDESVLEKLEQASTGVGKRRVEQVVLTHCHYDHASLLPKIVELYKPRVWAYTPQDDTTGKLKGGEILRLGDTYFDVIHVPGHSHDSICLASRTARAAFTGDMPLVVNAENAGYDREFEEGFKRLLTYDIEIIYPGHGSPIIESKSRVLARSLETLRRHRRY